MEGKIKNCVTEIKWHKSVIHDLENKIAKTQGEAEERVRQRKEGEGSMELMYSERSWTYCTCYRGIVFLLEKVVAITRTLHVAGA